MGPSCFFIFPLFPVAFYSIPWVNSLWPGDTYTLMNLWVISGSSNVFGLSFIGAYPVSKPLLNYYRFQFHRLLLNLDQNTTIQIKKNWKMHFKMFSARIQPFCSDLIWEPWIWHFTKIRRWYILTHPDGVPIYHSLNWTVEGLNTVIGHLHKYMAAVILTGLQQTCAHWMWGEIDILKPGQMDGILKNIFSWELFKMKIIELLF